MESVMKILSEKRKDNEESGGEEVQVPVTQEQQPFSSVLANILDPERKGTRELKTPKATPTTAPAPVSSTRGRSRMAMFSSPSDIADTGFITPPANTVQNVMMNKRSVQMNSYNAFQNVDPDKFYICENLKKKALAILRKPEHKEVLNQMKAEVRKVK